MKSALHQRRDEARASFARDGLPHRRVEAFKYSDIRARLAKAVAVSGVPADLTVAADNVQVSYTAHGDAPGWAAALLGALAPEFETPMARAALADAGPVACVRAGANQKGKVTLPLPPQGSHRIAAIVETGAELTLIEERRAGAGHFNGVVEAEVAPGGVLRHLVLTRGPAAGTVTAQTLVRLARDAQYDGAFVNLHDGFMRHDLYIALAGEGASARLTGLNALHAGGHGDFTTIADHLAPHCVSDQSFRNVVGAGGRGVYQGLVKVRPGAMKTDSRQSAKSLLLARDAEADAKPELEILADDVACAHGATVGDLDPMQLFYLRSRGIPETEARALLIDAFLEDLLARITDPALSKAAHDWLQGAAP